jgi:hypothetical protein
MPTTKKPATLKGRQRVLVSKENPNIFYGWNSHLAERTDRLFAAYRDMETGEIEPDQSLEEEAYAQAKARFRMEGNIRVDNEEVKIAS